MSPEDLHDLKRAKDKLENASLAAKVTNLIGAPLEKGFEKLPTAIRGKIEVITQAALMASMKTVILSMKDAPHTEKSNRLHKLAVATSGGIGGAFGFAGLAAELPISNRWHMLISPSGDLSGNTGERQFGIRIMLESGVTAGSLSRFDSNLLRRPAPADGICPQPG